MEEEGLVEHHVIESDTYRPAKKVYEMTEAGTEALRQWAMTPGPPEVIRDEFVLKMYNMWLLEPEQAIRQINEQRALHVERATYYEEHREDLKRQIEPDDQNYREPLFASIATLTFGLEYERHYVNWCDYMLDMLSRRQ